MLEDGSCLDSFTGLNTHASKLRKKDCCNETYCMASKTISKETRVLLMPSCDMAVEYGLDRTKCYRILHNKNIFTHTHVKNCHFLCICVRIRVCNTCLLLLAPVHVDVVCLVGFLRACGICLCGCVGCVCVCVSVCLPACLLIYVRARRVYVQTRGMRNGFLRECMRARV
jgi:hypothetical protein